MKTMKTVESRVLEILRDCPETRNEDMLLFYRYYENLLIYNGITQDGGRNGSTVRF